MKLRDEIHSYITAHKSGIISELKELIKIPSARGVSEKTAPFGKECNDALNHIKALYEKNGFETDLDGEGGYLLSYWGKGEKSLGLFSHADVVPVSDDWVFTSPFEPVEKDGYLIGRGALDDKSAVIISLYCMKMLKELDIPFNSRLVCFTGANEESGMEDIKNYIQNHKAPDFSLVCDTAFPLFRGNKGILHFVATQRKKMTDVTDFSGGTAFNIILGEAKAKIGRQAYKAKGISRHGALPEGSLNAAYVLAEKLSQSDLLCEEDKEQMRLIASILEKYYGEVYGIEHTDEDFGRLTVTNGIVKTENGKISLCFDMRYGASLDLENAKSKIVGFFDRIGWDVEFVLDSKPFVIPEDNKYIAACLDTYKSFTGDKDAATYINAGGTYARYLPCAAEIGTTLKWGRPTNTPEGHGNVHQPDECISIDGMLEALELTMLMLLECDKAAVQ